MEGVVVAAGAHAQVQHIVGERAPAVEVGGVDGEVAEGTDVAHGVSFREVVPARRGCHRGGAPHARPGGDEDTVARVWCASPIDSGGRERCRSAGWFYDDDDEMPIRPADFHNPVVRPISWGSRAERADWSFHHAG